MSGQQHTGHEARLPWQVVLIGGSSGTGKTILARALARHYGAHLLHMDDLRLAAEHLIAPAQNPALHCINTDPAVWASGEAFRDALVATYEAFEPAVAVVIANHIAQRGEFDPTIIEGDGILPRLGNSQYTAHSPHIAPISAADLAANVRTLVLHEPEEAGISAAMHARGRGFALRPPAEQRVQVRGSWLYGEWLRAEAERYGVPVLSSRPHDTQFARALALLDG